MRTLLSLAITAFFLLPTPAQAQSYPTDVGSYLLDGTASFTSTSFENSDDRSTSISINPRFQTFVVPGLALGGEFSLSSFSSSGDNTSTSFGAGPRVAYFFGGPETDTYPFLAGSALYSSIDGDATGLGLRASAGLSVMLAKNVAVSPEFFFKYQQLNVDGIDESQSLNTLGLAIGITGFIF